MSVGKSEYTNIAVGYTLTPIAPTGPLQKLYGALRDVKGQKVPLSVIRLY